MSVRMEDYSDKVLDTVQENINRTLTALGLAMVEVITDYMLTNYGRPIYLTGDLLRSITFKVNLSAKTVMVGTNLEYAQIIHNGGVNKTGRPFIKDALLENRDIWERIIRENMGDGFNLRFV